MPSTKRTYNQERSTTIQAITLNTNLLEEHLLPYRYLVN
jgi:hypothetical protein